MTSLVTKLKKSLVEKQQKSQSLTFFPRSPLLESFKRQMGWHGMIKSEFPKQGCSHPLGVLGSILGGAIWPFSFLCCITLLSFSVHPVLIVLHILFIRSMPNTWPSI